MDNDIVISAEGLGKRYRLGQVHHDRLADALTHGLVSAGRGLGRMLGAGNSVRNAGNGASAAPENRPDHIWALKDVSFEVRRGEVLGIVGKNGAGKTTLLKVLSGITEPTEGHARLEGRIGSLLEVGTGFHPELTGMENIFLNGAILGMSRREVRSRLDDIIAFAEIEEFLDTPIKRYSSGMYVRLAFAVAAHLEPEILLIDEVLAVGDVGFQKKCLGKMHDAANSGRTVLFVSHNMAAVESMCSRCLLVESGTITDRGDTSNVIRHYLDTVQRSWEGGDVAAYPRRAKTPERWISEVLVLSETGEPKDTFRMGEPLRIKLQLDGDRRLQEPRIGIGIDDELGRRVFTVGTEFDASLDLQIDRSATVSCDLPELMIAPGRYAMTVVLLSGRTVLDRIEDFIAFDVVEADVFGTGRVPKKVQGPLVCRSRWTVEDRT